MARWRLDISGDSRSTLSVVMLVEKSNTEIGLADMIITLFSGAPPEGDGPSQRKVLTAGREIQGDTDRKDSDRY